MLAIGVEGHMTRPGTGRDWRERHAVLDELAGAIEVPHIDLVGAEVDTEYVIAIEIGQDLVRVRPFLAVGVGAGPVADTLEIVGHCANRTAAVNLENLKISAGVAGRKQILP